MNAPRARQTPRPLILFALLAASSCGSENEPVRGASGSTGLGGTGGDSGGAGGNAGVSSGGSSASAGTGSGGAAGSAGAATGGTGALGGSSGSGATGGTSGSGSSPGTGGASPGNVYFRADHENPNPNGDQRYNYSYKYPQGSWTWTHLPTGGWGASGAAHIQMHAGQTQYSFGFVTQQLGHTFQNGEGVYIRFRIRYDEAMRGTPDWGNKFILMGTTGTTPNSRLIIYMNPPHPSRGCTLDDLLDEFARLRLANVGTLTELPLTAETLDWTGEHPEFGTVTLRQLLATWVAHDLGHLGQIARVQARRYTADVGPWRRYLRVIGEGAD